jgi:hypothetical protein
LLEVQDLRKGTVKRMERLTENLMGLKKKGAGRRREEEIIKGMLRV